MSQELTILIPEKTYTINGEDVIIKPFKFKQFPQVLDIIDKYFSQLENLVRNEDIINLIEIYILLI